MATENKRPVFINVTTPVGIAVWPKLNSADTKFKSGGEFNVKLKHTAEEAQPMIDKYEAALVKHFDEVKAELMKGDGKSKAKAKALKMASKPYTMEVDDEGEETGNVLFNWKMPHRIAREGKADLVLFPDIFDAGGRKLKNPPEIWGGSKLVVAGQLRPFDSPIAGVGLSLRLLAVQIIELQTKGGRDATGYGFGATEGGYEGNDEMPSGDGDDATPPDSSVPAGDNPDF